jgi:hypothetical protein
VRLHAQARNKSWRESERILERESIETFAQRDIREIKRFNILEILDAAVARGSTTKPTGFWRRSGNCINGA